MCKLLAGRSHTLFRVVVAFAWGAWYGIALAIAGGIATFGAAAALLLTTWRYLSRRVNPEPPPVPDVVLGHPGAQISLTPLHELQEGESSRLVSVRPTYLIENKDAVRSIRDVSTGVRTRDGSQEHVFSEFFAPLIGAKETVPFRAQESIPVDWLADVHESVAQLAFLYWVRFKDTDGRGWEVVYDPETRTCTARLV